MVKVKDQFHWNVVDQDNNLVASCTLDAGTEGSCEFTLGGELSNNDEIKIEVKKAQGQKCQRCWKILEKKCERCSRVLQ